MDIPNELSKKDKHPTIASKLLWEKSKNIRADYYIAKLYKDKQSKNHDMLRFYLRFLLPNKNLSTKKEK
jgi:hypothetical protein